MCVPVLTRTRTLSLLLVVTLAGGCGQAPAGPAPAERGAARNSSLEAKAQRLEEDFRAAASARDQFRQKLLAAEDRLAIAEGRLARLQAELEASRATLASARKENEGLRADLQARTTERDQLALQYDAFRKSLRELLGHADAALSTPSAMPSSVEPSAPVSSAPVSPALRN